MSLYIYMLVNAVANLSRVTAVWSEAEYCRCPGFRRLILFLKQRGRACYLTDGGITSAANVEFSICKQPSAALVIPCVSASYLFDYQLLKLKYNEEN